MMAATSRREFLWGPLRRMAGGRAVPATEDRDAVGNRSPSPATLVARIDADRCLNAMSQMCTVCVERCPVQGAIRLETMRPVIDAQACTGCGVCSDCCPAPEVAIALVARGRDR